MNPGKVFYSVLNMGLGHATRSLPIIQEFIDRKWQIWVGSNGRSLQFLKRELPEVSFIETPDYGISYSRGGLLLPKLVLQIPKMMRKIREEKRLCDRVCEEISPDLIISDHCYGVYHSKIPSYFISHQIRFAMPESVQFLSGFISQFNLTYHKHYEKVLIPDFPDGTQGLLSGMLSDFPNSEKKYHFAGILSSLKKKEVPGKIVILVSISGPEPQRSVFEEIILEQINEVDGNKIIVLGKSEKSELLIQKKDLKVYSHLPRDEMETLFNQAEVVITRPGYSTLMELVELGKKALLVPTPGQTEQLYLARQMMKNGWFYSVEQDSVDLPRDIRSSIAFQGLKKTDATRSTIKNIFDNLLKI
jgi:uncharacterized protein (TIGR00661 family)